MINVLDMTDTDNKSSALEDVWLIRPCEVYREEYQYCKRWKNRLVQYYVDGEMADCKGLLDNFNNCIAFRERKDEMAAVTLINKEKERRKERLQKANANDVWEYRTSPPNQWSASLHRNKPQEGNNLG